MLAADSVEGGKQSDFFLVVRPHQPVAELMIECLECGAITCARARFVYGYERT